MEENGVWAFTCDISLLTSLVFVVTDSSYTAQYVLLANSAETSAVLKKVHYSITLRGQERPLHTQPLVKKDVVLSDVY